MSHSDWDDVDIGKLEDLILRLATYSEEDCFPVDYYLDAMSICNKINKIRLNQIKESTKNIPALLKKSD